MGAPLAWRIVATIAVSCALAAAAACNSDDKGTTGASGTDTTTTGPSTMTSPSTGTSLTTDATETGANTCRDALQCMISCIPADNATEDEVFRCFLECQVGLGTDDVLAFIRLWQCINNKCTDEGFCMPPPEPTGTGTSSTSGGTATTGTSGATGTTGGMTCFECTAFGFIEPMPMGCEEEALACTFEP